MRRPLFTNEHLEEARIRHKKIKKCHKILREIFFNAMFIWVLFVVSYSNQNENSFNYQHFLENTFTNYKQVKKNEKKLFRIPF